MDDNTTPSDTALDFFLKDIESDESINQELKDSLLKDINSGSYNLPDLNITITSLMESKKSNASN